MAETMIIDASELRNVLHHFINDLQILAEQKAEGDAKERLLLDAVLRLVQDDPHSWSARPCATCRTITSLVGRPFGCSLRAVSKADKGPADVG